MSLTANDFAWYSREYDSVGIVLNYGNFPNVPLIGTRGYINYNQVLALRQLGYPMVDKPKEKSVEGFIIYEGAKESDMMNMIGKAWNKVHYKGKTKKNCIAKKPYTPVGSRKSSHNKDGRSL